MLTFHAAISVDCATSLLVSSHLCTSCSRNRQARPTRYPVSPQRRQYLRSICSDTLSHSAVSWTVSSRPPAYVMRYAVPSCDSPYLPPSVRWGL